MIDDGANLIWEVIYFTLPTREDTEVHFWPSGGRGNFKTMFVSDGHKVLDILPIRSDYGGRGASRQVNLRVIAGISAR